jgi:hypothetical protein
LEDVRFKKLVEELKLEIREEIRSGLQQFKEECMKEINDLKKTVDKLEKDCRDKDVVIDIITQQVNSLDQYSRNKNFEIENIEQVKGERLEAVVLDIAKHIDINLSIGEIDAVHRLPVRRDSTRPPKIIVQLTTRRKRDLFINRRRDASDLQSKQVIAGGRSEERIYINENLTAYNRDLLWKAKARGRDQQYRFVWYKFGKILAKQNELPNTQVIRINSVKDIEKIKLV